MKIKNSIKLLLLLSCLNANSLVMSVDISPEAIGAIIWSAPLFLLGAAIYESDHNLSGAAKVAADTAAALGIVAYSVISVVFVAAANGVTFSLNSPSAPAIRYAKNPQQISIDMDLAGRTGVAQALGMIPEGSTPEQIVTIAQGITSQQAIDNIGAWQESARSFLTFSVQVGANVSGTDFNDYLVSINSNYNDAMQTIANYVSGITSIKVPTGYRSSLDYLVQNKITTSTQLNDLMSQVKDGVLPSRYIPSSPSGEPSSGGPVVNPEGDNPALTNDQSTITNSGSSASQLSVQEIASLDLSASGNYTTLLQQYGTNKAAVKIRMVAQYEALSAEIEEAGDEVTSDLQAKIDAYDAAAETIDGYDAEANLAEITVK